MRRDVISEVASRNCFDYASRKFNKAAPPKRFIGLIVVSDSSSQRQHGRHDTQTIVWLSHGKGARNARVLSTREHQRRVRRDAKERTVIAAGIESAHIKVPMIVRKDHQVAFDQAPLATMKLAQLA